MIVPTAWAAASVTGDYGVEPGRVRVVPLGANLLDVAEGGEGEDAAPPPIRGGLRLIITAADPQRKRLDLAIDTVEVLRTRGWDATLTYIGPPTPRAESLAFVGCAGRLRLSEDADRHRHGRLLRESHLMILPSQAEAFGIAPVEAAHLGRPAVVSGAGGLAEVVVDGQTGRVVNPAAPAEAYADAVEDIVASTERYPAMCHAARERARAVLTWEHFAAAAIRIMRMLAA